MNVNEICLHICYNTMQFKKQNRINQQKIYAKDGIKSNGSKLIMLNYKNFFKIGDIVCVFFKEAKERF